MTSASPPITVRQLPKREGNKSPPLQAEGVSKRRSNSLFCSYFEASATFRSCRKVTLIRETRSSQWRHDQVILPFTYGAAVLWSFILWSLFRYI